MLFNMLFWNFSCYVSGCEALNLKSLTSDANNIFSNFNNKKDDKVIVGKVSTKSVQSLEINEIVETASASVNFNGTFKEIIKQSVEENPEVLSAKANYQSRVGSIELAKAATEFKLSGTLLGGVEDLTDETAGIAAVVNGKKVIYDGGKISSQVSREEFLSSAALSDYRIKQNEITADALFAWVDVKRYSTLRDLIQSRLEVLAPLIEQLEQVAQAGVGDASQVAAAERTVNTIRVTEKNVARQLAQAEVKFENIFGENKPSVSFDGNLISSRSIPSSEFEKLVSSSPLVNLHYARYGAAVANLNSVIAKKVLM